METLLYDKCTCKLGIDTMRIKLARLLASSKFPIQFFIDNLKVGLEKHDVTIYPDGNYHFLKDNHSKRKVAKLYMTPTKAYVIEIFGMFQTHNLFQLSNIHTTIFFIVGNLKGFHKTLEKIDVACDLFYPHERIFVFDGLGLQSDMFDILNYQRKFPIVYLTDLPMITVRIPNKYKKIINFALRHKEIKPTDEMTRGDCYYRWVKQTSCYMDRINYGQCEKSESTHCEIKVNKRKVFFAVAKNFDGSASYSVEYDHENDIHLGRQPRKISHIKYNKSLKDSEKSEDNVPMKEIYTTIIKEIAADNDDEHHALMKYVENFPHTRFESIFIKPGVTTKQNSLDLEEGSNFDLLLPYFKKNIEKHNIFILRPFVSPDEYLKVYEDRLEKVSAVRPIISDKYGKIIGLNETNWDDLAKQIENLKLFFVKPS